MPWGENAPSGERAQRAAGNASSRALRFAAPGRGRKVECKRFGRREKQKQISSAACKPRGFVVN